MWLAESNPQRLTGAVHAERLAMRVSQASMLRMLIAPSKRMSAGPSAAWSCWCEALSVVVTYQHGLDSSKRVEPRALQKLQAGGVQSGWRAPGGAHATDG